MRFDVGGALFVTPAFVGGRSFWWDALADESGLSVEVRRHGLEALAGRDEAVRPWAAARGLAVTEPGPMHRCGTEAELARAAATPGIALGSHTWGHANLARLDLAELEAELERPLTRLRARFPATLPWISYSYGLATPAVLAAARRAGYEGGLLVAGGRLRPGAAPPLALPRLNVPAGVSSRGFGLRVSGLVSRGA